MSLKNRVGIYAASSIVPIAEFNLGMAVLKESGFEVTVHPQVHAEHFIYPGTDEERAGALYELACDNTTDILWAAQADTAQRSFCRSSMTSPRSTASPSERKSSSATAMSPCCTNLPGTTGILRRFTHPCRRG